MKWYYKIEGSHTHVRVFMNGGKCGDRYWGLFKSAFRSALRRVWFRSCPSGKPRSQPSGGFAMSHPANRVRTLIRRLLIWCGSWRTNSRLLIGVVVSLFSIPLLGSGAVSVEEVGGAMRLVGVVSNFSNHPQENLSAVYAVDEFLGAGLLVGPLDISLCVWEQASKLPLGKFANNCCRLGYSGSGNGPDLNSDFGGWNSPYIIEGNPNIDPLALFQKGGANVSYANPGPRIILGLLDYFIGLRQGSIHRGQLAASDYILKDGDDYQRYRAEGHSPFWEGLLPFRLIIIVAGIFITSGAWVMFRLGSLTPYDRQLNGWWRTCAVFLLLAFGLPVLWIGFRLHVIAFFLGL